MSLTNTRNEVWRTTMDAPGKMEMIRIQSEVTRIQSAVAELECKIIRFKTACLSSFSRPIDRENLTEAQYELSALRLQLSST